MDIEKSRNMEVSTEKQSPLLAKCVAMVTLFTISLILGALPMLIAKKFNWETDMKKNKYAQILLAIGGGVLMSTTFIHLLPEVSENIEKIEQFQGLKFPLAETLTCIGFFLIYFVEECVHLYLHKQQRLPQGDIMRKSVSILRGEVYSPNKNENEFVMSILDLENQIRASKENQLTVPSDLILIKKNPDSTLNSTRNSYDVMKKSTDSAWRTHLSSARNSRDLIRKRGDNHELGHAHNHESAHAHHHAHGEEHSHLVGDEKFLGSMRGLMVVFALSVHEILEGLSVGLESKPKNVWYMFVAVGAHKFIIAFCVGVELLSSGIKNKIIFIYVFTFAVVSPLGIAIGILISAEGPASSEIPSVILQGFATGTLLYVIFFEILKKNEMEGNGLNKYIAVLFGFIAMFFTTVLLSDDDLDDE